MNQEFTEYVVVFKKEIEPEKAIHIMNTFSFSFHEGSDSSKGKIYFYRTGPKFIIKIPKIQKTDFLNKSKTISEIYEIYAVNWNIQKD